jgi:hypothetical protein
LKFVPSEGVLGSQNELKDHIKEEGMTNFTTIRIPQNSPNERATVVAASKQFGTLHPERWAIRGKVVATSEDEDGKLWAEVRLEWVGAR